ncbi:hypothetical protein BLNAU_18347 [Blattamonas nauphoetae]|uniref:Right handed beta helix domain-containing protein n=1 Tax=Blattamonas nauphoetae TaxID=2049346 RepID=A0ABQ9X919_9EUKA|nr:hypothetical protein BLNAU_18347 [Blattamonas nauphoetae]
MMHLFYLIFQVLLCQKQPSPSLRALLDARTADATNPESTFVTELCIPSGQFLITSYLVESDTLNLRGNKTTIMHIEERREPSRPELTIEAKNGIDAETSTNTMFLFSNSTISLWDLSLDSGGMGTTVARLSASCVSIWRSRILSNAERSPYVIVGGGSGGWGSVSLVDSVHESSSRAILLPLVWESEREKREEMKRDGSGEMKSIWVSASGLIVQDVRLIVGSGPLFGRSEQNQREPGKDVEKVGTRLIGSRIWNTTSGVGERRGLGVWAGEIEEGIIGSDVRESTNHLCGTAMREIGSGGSQLSHNTSFTRCHTPSTPNDDPNTDTGNPQHFTTQTILTNKTDTSHVFTLCTFKECASDEFGGAIFTFNDGIKLQIGKCSFDSCSASSDGGAINLSPPENAQFHFHLSSSSFLKCSASSWGGSISLYGISDITIEDCAFLDSSIGSFGGAIYLHSCPFGASPGFSNTLFQNCEQKNSDKGGGGAVRLWNCTSSKFASIQFRSCSAARGYGHDLLFRDSPFTSSSFADCDSTSSTPHRVSDETTNSVFDNSSYLKTTPYEASIQSLTSELTAADAVTLKLTLSKKVTGKVIVVVDNSDATRHELPDTAPKIVRMLIFTFSSSTVGTCSASVGESGILQHPLSDYKLLAASFSENKVSIPSGLTIPVTSIILLTRCVLSESKTEVDISFSGWDIPEGHRNFFLNSGPVIEVAFNNDEYGRSLGSATAGVSGKNGELTEKTEYTITKIEHIDCLATQIFTMGLTINVPEAARLSMVSVSRFVDARRTTVKLSFESIMLEANKKHILDIEPTDYSEGTITREVWTDTNGILFDVTEILYPLKTDDEERAQQLKFGGTYRVLSLRASDRTRSVIISDIEFTIPNEPEQHPLVCSYFGSTDTENCGQSSNPCSSLLVGWKAGQTQQESPEDLVELGVEGEVELGGVLFVGERKLAVWGGERGQVLVEWRDSWKSPNAIEVNGGQILIVEVTILLGEPKEGGGEKKESFLIHGGGEVSLESVVIGGLRGGRVRMGLVGLSWGSAELVEIKMDGIDFGDGVRFADVRGEKKVVSLSVKSLTARSVRTLNAPLIEFLGRKEESEVKMEKIVLLETTREEDGEGVGTDAPRVISLSTIQRETRIANCVFEESKTKRLSDGGDLGGVLFVGVGGEGGGSVRFEDCLLIDTVPNGKGGGGVAVVVSSGTFSVVFERCWMEETSVTGMAFEHLNGLPIRGEKRRVVSGGNVGALIIGEKSLPIVVRSSSRFSGCSLKVDIETSASISGQKNEEKLEL